jgi:hypothetical protein
MGLRAGHLRRWWLIVAGSAMVGGLVGVVLLMSFLWNGKDPGRTDQWLNIVGLSLAWLAAVAPIVGWAIRQASKDGDEASDSRPLTRLRQAVDAVWGREVVARPLYLPHPLQLRLRSTPRSGVRVNSASGGAAAGSEL